MTAGLWQSVIMWLSRDFQMRKYLVWLRCHKEYITGTSFGIIVTLILIATPLLFSPAKPSKKITVTIVSKGIASAGHRGDMVVFLVELPNRSKVKMKSVADSGIAINEEVCVLQNTSSFGLHTHVLLKKGTCD
ncbi:hypothetical protein L3V77_21350 [Vibrio sp. DW001]|uniref:hypothetical protein n=1 Tax=Vibrio sp. DW001 TaxID=2912315 RepID=UPI0023AF4421|nr:hypothetical protein [Vibrio sp. DW001]WED28500.1 hypothetical protein L3V77_21350 [Vibrio sp. DW001]